jgi:arginine decarboxylase
MGQKLGHQIFIVMEQLSEVDVLLEVADEMGVVPTAGVRIKLASEGAGRWAQSGGEKSKFGLNPAQLVKLIDRLRAAGRLAILKLIHFHLGSQITDIRFIKTGLQEITRFYAELRNMGVDISHVDVGGGLGVDYDGTASTGHASVNYSLQEYANDIIYTIAESCREHELPMPHIISESGRALTAHHALLLLKVIDVESQAEPPIPQLGDDDAALLHEMAEDYRAVQKSNLPARKVLEIYHDATFDKELALPVAAGQLGDRPALPHHAHSPAGRGAGAQGDAAGRHLRLGREDRPLRGRQEWAAEPGAAQLPRGRGLRARHLPHRRLPGDPGRPA